MFKCPFYNECSFPKHTTFQYFGPIFKEKSFNLDLKYYLKKSKNSSTLSTLEFIQNSNY